MDGAKDANNAAKIHQVLTWILEGNSEHLIREAVAETWPGEDATPLIIAAFDQVATNAEQLRGSVADWCIESMRFLYQKQVEIGEYGGAMRAITELNKLAGKSAQPAKHEGTAEAFPRILDAADRRKELAARIARLG